jgi:hypothetical protein
VPAPREIDHNIIFENRDFLHQMNQEGVLLKEIAAKKLWRKLLRTSTGSMRNTGYLSSSWIWILKKNLIEKGFYLVIW